MVMPSRIAGALFGLALAAAATPAGAQIAITNGSYNLGTYSGGYGSGVIYGTDAGWTVLIDACQLNGGASPGSCSSDVVVISATATSLSLVFENATNGSNLLSSTSLEPSQNYADLTVGAVSVVAPGTSNIWQVTDSLVGSAGSGGNSLLTTTLGSFVGLQTTLGTTGLLKTYTNSIVSGTDTRDTAPASGTNSITSATYVYAAPEPVSLSLFCVGLVALSATRARKRSSSLTGPSR